MYQAILLRETRGQVEKQGDRWSVLKHSTCPLVSMRPSEEVVMGKVTPALYHGVPAHGARPHLGVNAIVAAAAAINAVNAIHLNPNESYSIKATQFISDSGVTNAIPAEATVIRDIRSELNSTMDTLLEKAKSGIVAGAASIGATVDVTNYNSIPGAEYSREMIDVLTEAILTEYGSEGLCKPIKTAGGEDFHYYMKKKPSLKAGYFGLGCDLTPGLHHPNMDFDKNALERGKNVLIYAAQKLLS